MSERTPYAVTTAAKPYEWSEGKWQLGAGSSTADPDILPTLINTSSIMVGNAASIMAREAAFANAD